MSSNYCGGSSSRDKMLLKKGYPLFVLTLFLHLTLIFGVTRASGHSGEELSDGGGDSSRILAVTTGMSGDHSQKIVQVVAHPQQLHQLQQQQLASSGSSIYGVSRPGRHLGLGSSSSSLSPTNLLGLASASNYGYADNVVPEYGEHGAASGSYGHSHSHGYGGWGFAEPEHHHVPVNYSAVGLLGFLALLSLIQAFDSLRSDFRRKKTRRKADCNSALGLLGVLGLVSFLQNVLRQMSTTTVSPNNGRRRKRSDQENHAATDTDHGFDYTNDLHRVTTLILPLLTAVAHARDRFIPNSCTHREICKANGVLTKEFGSQGRSLGSTITEAVAKMLTKETKFGFMEIKTMRAAGKSGRNGDNCNELFKNCVELQWLPTYSIPPTMFDNQEFMTKSSSYSHSK